MSPAELQDELGSREPLRGLLRFLFLEGLTPNDLTGAVPGVAKWRAASLPQALPVDHVAVLLAELRSDDRGRSA